MGFFERSGLSIMGSSGDFPRLLLVCKQPEQLSDQRSLKYLAGLGLKNDCALQRRGDLADQSWEPLFTYAVLSR